MPQLQNPEKKGRIERRQNHDQAATACLNRKTLEENEGNEQKQTQVQVLQMENHAKKRRKSNAAKTKIQNMLKRNTEKKSNNPQKIVVKNCMISLCTQLYSPYFFVA